MDGRGTKGICRTDSRTTRQEPVFGLDPAGPSVYEHLMLRKKPSPSPKGMRIQLQGLRSTAELRAMLHEAIDHLESLGVTHGRGANFYVTPCDTDGNMLTPLGSGRTIIDRIIIEGPYPSAADEHGA